MYTHSSFMAILMIGLNHKSAPVYVHERLAFGVERTPVVLKELLKDEIRIKEAVLLSTCKRLEITVKTSHPLTASICHEVEYVVR